MAKARMEERRSGRLRSTAGHRGRLWRHVYAAESLEVAAHRSVLAAGPDEFPRCEQTLPHPGSEFVDPSTGLTIPRVWLINAADDCLVQLQPGGFSSTGAGEKVLGHIPGTRHFRTIFRAFSGVSRFRCQDRLGEIEVSEYELTYINHVFEQEDWEFPASIGRVMEHLVLEEGTIQVSSSAVPDQLAGQI